MLRARLTLQTGTYGADSPVRGCIQAGHGGILAIIRMTILSSSSLDPETMYASMCVLMRVDMWGAVAIIDRRSVASPESRSMPKSDLPELADTIVSGIEPCSVVLFGSWNYHSSH